MINGECRVPNETSPAFLARIAPMNFPGCIKFATRFATKFMERNSADRAGRLQPHDAAFETQPAPRHMTGAAGFGASILFLGLAFYYPLSEWAVFASQSDFYSHVLLVPLLTVYLARINRSAIPWDALGRSLPGAVAFGLLGLALLTAAWFGAQSTPEVSHQDWLFLVISAWVCFLIASLLFFFGLKVVWSMALPVGMLFFMAPFPTAMESGIESFFQQTSAMTAALLLNSSGTAVLRDGLILRLPGIVLDVTPACSGLRSSLVLFITSLAAGYLFLRSPVRRGVLAIAVVPLAILRNGVRIFTLGTLCVHADPGWINSWIHTRGGPLFFALSLVPFAALLLWLRRTEPQAKQV